MKYRKIPVIVDAEVYRRGLEDGFECFGIFGGRYLGYYEKGTAIPKVNQVPAINTINGLERIIEGYYIVTDDNGNKTILSPDQFRNEFEEVKDVR